MPSREPTWCAAFREVLKLRRAHLDALLDRVKALENRVVQGDRTRSSTIDDKGVRRAIVIS